MHLQKTGLGGVLVGLLALFSVAVPLAWAHAELREAAPAPGSLFRWQRPAEVRLRFTQQLKAASIVVTDRHFVAVQATQAQISADNPRETFVPLQALRPATYTVNWQVTSEDGHTLDGAYDFTVLPREPVITMVVAAIVLPLFALFIYTRRARDGE